MIYADNAATTKMSKAAIDAMLPYMEEYYGNPSSLYAFGQQAKEALENCPEPDRGPASMPIRGRSRLPPEAARRITRPL